MKRLNWTRRPRKVALVAFQRGWRGVTGWTRRLQGAVAFAVRLVDRWLNESVRRVFRFLENRLGPITVVVIAVVVALSIVFWDWLSFGESGSTTIRNVGLVLAALVALPLAVWRSKVAERQASAAQRQADTAQQNLLNERYQQGAEMLGSDVLAVRLGGIYALQRLAEEHPEQYHIQIMRLFCAFARNPPIDDRVETTWVPPDSEIRRLRVDVQDVMTTVSACHARQIKLERDTKFRLELSGANLAGIYLSNANLAEANLHSVDLSDAQLEGGILSGASFWDTNLCRANLKCGDLSDATFWDSDLSDANLNRGDLSGASIGRTEFRHTGFRRTELSGTDFSSHDRRSQAGGLIQAQLDEARADPDNPPKLDGILDAETGKQLVWQRDPCDNRKTPSGNRISESS